MDTPCCEASAWKGFLEDMGLRKGFERDKWAELSKGRGPLGKVMGMAAGSLCGVMLRRASSLCHLTAG